MTEKNKLQETTAPYSQVFVQPEDSPVLKVTFDNSSNNQWGYHTGGNKPHPSGNVVLTIYVPIIHVHYLLMHNDQAYTNHLLMHETGELLMQIGCSLLLLQESPWF